MLVQRMLGVLKLNRKVFEDIKRDEGANMQAAIIVLLAAVLHGLGAAGLLNNLDTGPIATIVANFIGWFLITILAFIVGVKLFKGKATFAELARLVGFAFTPHLLGIIAFAFSLVPILHIYSTAIYIAVMAWSALTLFFAISIGLRFEAGKTLGLLIICVFPYLIALGIVIQFFSRI